METLPWFSCRVTFSRGSASILFEVEKRRKKNKKLRQEKRFYSVKRKGEGALGKTSPVSKCTYVCFWNGIPGGVTSRPFVFRLFERGKFWNSPSSKSLWLQRVWSPKFPLLLLLPPVQSQKSRAFQAYCSALLRAKLLRFRHISKLLYYCANHMSTVQSRNKWPGLTSNLAASESCPVAPKRRHLSRSATFSLHKL